MHNVVMAAGGHVHINDWSLIPDWLMRQLAYPALTRG